MRGSTASVTCSTAAETARSLGVRSVVSGSVVVERLVEALPRGTVAGERFDAAGL